MKPTSMMEIIDKKRYNTDTATLLAGNDFWDGHNWERQGTNCFLYRTPKGNYFLQHLTQWIGRKDAIEPISQNEAIKRFEDLTERRVSFEEAFPGVTIEEA